MTRSCPAFAHAANFSYNSNDSGCLYEVRSIERRRRKLEMIDPTTHRIEITPNPAMVDERPKLVLRGFRPVVQNGAVVTRGADP
jgi:hypothetical protein